MKTRKLVLIIADVVLLAVCIIQGIVAAHDGVKNIDLDETPDEYSLVTPGETIHLVCEDDKWYINDQKYPAANNYVEQFTDAISSIRCLDKVGTLNENTVNKYELADGKKITVIARKAGKQLRTIEIGKETNSGSQTYIVIDGGKDIYLASGTLRLTFDKTVTSLRSKVIWGFDKASVNSASITFADGTNWSVSRMGSGEDVAWTISDSNVELDAEKASSMFDSMATVTTQNWYGDNVTAESLGGQLVLTAKLGHDYNTSSIQIYKLVEEAADGGEPSEKYYATSSETPYVFELASYAVDKFNKKPEDLAK